MSTFLDRERDKAAWSGELAVNLIVQAFVSVLGAPLYKNRPEKPPRWSPGNDIQLHPRSL